MPGCLRWRRDAGSQPADPCPCHRGPPARRPVQIGFLQQPCGAVVHARLSAASLAAARLEMAGVGRSFFHGYLLGCPPHRTTKYRPRLLGSDTRHLSDRGQDYLVQRNLQAHLTGGVITGKGCFPLPSSGRSTLFMLDLHHSTAVRGTEGMGRALARLFSSRASRCCLPSRSAVFEGSIPARFAMGRWDWSASLGQVEKGATRYGEENPTSNSDAEIRQHYQRRRHRPRATKPQPRASNRD